MAKNNSSYAYVKQLPDGGWGWVIVFAAFCTNFIWGGLYNSYGILYREFLTYFNEPRSYTSWIGSLLTGVGYACGILASGLINKFGIRPVAMVGALMSSVACFASSYANSVLALIISFGLFVGLGHALSYTATYIIVPYYFEKRRGLATGIAIAGSGVGNFVFAPLIRYLLQEYTWRGFMIIESGVILQCCVFAALYRPISLVKVPSGVDFADDVELETETEIITTDDSRLMKSEIPPVVIGDDFKETFRFRIGSDATEYRMNRKEKAKLRRAQQQRNDSKYKSICRKLSKIQEAACEQHQRCKSVGTVDEDEWAEFLRSREGETLKLLLLEAVKMDTSPFLRKDIFYASSLRLLPEYRKNTSEKYSQSVLSLPRAIENIVTTAATDDKTSASLAVTSQNDDADTTSSSIFSKNRCVSFLIGIREVFGLSLLTKPEFVMYSCATFAFYFGYYIPTSVLYDYSTSQLNYTKNQGIILVSTMGIANTVGRIAVGFFSDMACINRVTLYSLIMVFMGLVNETCWLFGYSYAILLVYAILFSIAVGAAKALLIVVAVDLMGLENLTHSYGLLLLFQGFGFLLGSPCAGALYDATGSYALPFSLLGGVLMLSGLMVYLSPKLKTAKEVRNCFQCFSNS